MLRIGTLRWKGRCARHPKYDPVGDGEGGIRGGCVRCMSLLEIHQQHRRLMSMMRDFGPVRARTNRSNADGAPRRQPSLFD
jgi:hypothetical protein